MSNVFNLFIFADNLSTQPVLRVIMSICEQAVLGTWSKERHLVATFHY